MRTIARLFAEMANDVSPIKMFQKEQAGKMAAEVGGSFRGFDVLSNQLGLARSRYASSGRSFASDFWAGHDMEAMATNLTDNAASLMSDPAYTKAMQRRAFLRKAAVGALAVGTIGKVVMGNNLITDAADAAVAGGTAFGAAGAAFHLGHSTGSVGAKILGWGITGLTARNVMTSGDNWGPF